MIIKSMSRKQASFSQLVDYFEDGRQDDKYTIYHNVYSTDAEKVKAEFMENASLLRKRKNGVYMYHEILSITKTRTISEERQKEILKNIGLDYIRNRARNNLVFGVLHDDKNDNFHYHFMISSNELQNEKRHRLSKTEFSEFKKNLERMVLAKYPELEQTKLIDKEPGMEKSSGEKISKKGAELRRRTGKTDQRDDVKERLKKVFSASKTKAGFFAALDVAQLAVYVRGNTVGIIDKITDRKHRLNTLGLLDEFQAVSKIIEQSEPAKEDGRTDKNEFAKEKIDTRQYRQSGETAKEPDVQPENSYQASYADGKNTESVDRENDMAKNADFSAEEVFDEREAEIRKRRDAVKKSRKSGPDFDKDFSKGK